MRNPESIIKDGVLAVFIGTDARVWNHPTGTAIAMHGHGMITYGLPGSSDLIGILPGGRFLAIETKTKRGVLSPAQQNFRAMVEKLGGLYIVARSGAEARAAIEAAGFMLWSPSRAA